MNSEQKAKSYKTFAYLLTFSKKVKDENGEYKTVCLPDVQTLATENSQRRTIYENGELFHFK